MILKTIRFGKHIYSYLLLLVFHHRSPASEYDFFDIIAGVLQETYRFIIFLDYWSSK